MERSALTSMVKDSGNVMATDRSHSKRKVYPKEDRPFLTASFDYKRHRQNDISRRSWPLNSGAVNSHERGAGQSGQSDSRINESNAPADNVWKDLRHGYSKKCEDKETKSEKQFKLHSRENASTASIFGSGAGNTSTVTSSTEEAESSRLLQNSGQTPHSQVGASNSASAEIPRRNVHSISTCRHSSKRRKGPRQSLSHRERWKRRTPDRVGGGDSEVLSGVSKNSLSTLSHSPEMQQQPNKVRGLFGSMSRSASDGNLYGMAEATCCVADSGCGSVDEGDLGRRSSAGEVSQKRHGSSKRAHEISGETLQSLSLPETLQGSSVLTDLSPSSRTLSTLPGLKNPYKKYRSREPSSKKKSPAAVGLIKTAGGESLEEYSPWDAVKIAVRRSEEDPDDSCTVSSPPKSSRLLERQESGSTSMHRKSQSMDIHTDDDGGSEENSPPTFVLSSGRLSKEEEKKLGMRPTTIDDDFDQYFSQLVL